jgi:hypothetical protein
MTDRLNVYAPWRHDAGLALRELESREKWEENKAREVALRAFYRRERQSWQWLRRLWSRTPWWARFALEVIVLFILSALFLVLWPAQADTIKQVAQEIKYSAALPMSGNVSQELAGNILQAQALATYGSPESLDLSIQAVLRAIGIYVFSGGPKQINEACCPAVWAQSTIAIDPNAGGVITPTALAFADPVATPEPGVLLFVIAGALWLLAISSKAHNTREYPASHAFRK